jgi:uncharacterized membrane protein YcaP (DUF421 family)
MAFFHNAYMQIAFSSIAVYLFILGALRIFGKKELAQLSVVDLVFILLISNSVQNAMVGNNSTLSGGLVAATALFATNYILKNLAFHFPKIGKWLQGETLMLIYQGKVNHANLDKAMISLDELSEAVREHGVTGIQKVNLAVLETDGNISILSKEFSHRTQHKRRTQKSLTSSGTH